MNNTSGVSGTGMNGGEGSVHGGSVVSVASTSSVISGASGANGVVKPALVTRIRTTPTNTNTMNVRTANPATTNTNINTTTTTTTTTANGQLTLQVLEHDLANLSMVEAPARWVIYYFLLGMAHLSCALLVHHSLFRVQAFTCYFLLLLTMQLLADQHLDVVELLPE